MKNVNLKDQINPAKQTWAELNQNQKGDENSFATSQKKYVDKIRSMNISMRKDQK